MTKKNKIVMLLSILFIIGNAGVNVFLIDNQKKKIKSIQHRLASARKIAVPDTDSETEKHITARYDIKKAVNDLPHVFTFTEQAGKIGTIIDRNRLYLQKSMLFKSEKSDRLSLTKYSTNIIVTGDYKGLKGFIADIQNSPELICMTNLRFKRSSDNDSRISLACEISIFFKGKSQGNSNG